jgi:hypothetical protein
VPPRGPPSSSQIDRFMERASRALEAMRYFEVERLCHRAMRLAHLGLDFERMARIALPLQEARRQRRLQAVDSGHTAIVDRPPHPGGPIAPGCYLIRPPLIGVDARVLRDRADDQGVPVISVAREPLTRDGRWPVVTVGAVSVRSRLDPPYPVLRVETTPTKDDSSAPPPPSWFEAALERMGDDAIARVNPADPAAWRVEEFLELLDAHRDHEKLHQRLADACRAAMTEPPPLRPRRKTGPANPYSF